jgi:hypothetical protein
LIYSPRPAEAHRAGSAFRLITNSDAGARPQEDTAMSLSGKRHLFASPAWLLGLALALGALACNLTGAGNRSAGVPAPSIQSPAAGATVAAGETVPITIAATDEGDGIARVEVYVNGAMLGSVAVEDGPATAAVITQDWTPTEEGEANLMAIAYRADGTGSAPATIAVMVASVTPDPAQAEIEPAADAADQPSEDESEADDSGEPAPPAPVQGKANAEANVRTGPGTACPEMGFVNVGETLNLLEWSADRDWLKTDVLGPDRTGWIHASLVDIEGDADAIPQGTSEGCVGCGDGICGASEDCHDCPSDCGDCCGNDVCDAAFGEDCTTCEDDCGACCGDGACVAFHDEDETTCPEDCAPRCGDGTCDAMSSGENCFACPEDCGDCCGNAICDGIFGESFVTCPEDCVSFPSDRALKENVIPVDPQAVLEALSRVPIARWSYTFDDAGTPHMGPMAQDFYAAFGLGEDDRHIYPLDASGVALAAVQGIHESDEAQDARIAALEARLETLETAQARSRTLVWIVGAMAVCGGLAGYAIGRRTGR